MMNITSGTTSSIWSRITHPWNLAFAGLALLAAGFVLLAAVQAPELRSTIWLEVAKAASQAIPVLVLGIP
ncbi:MAG TPA: hypothetical protein VNP97_04045, partial [Microbacterium sp.]|nr:hypothetical protein [Microbacterium sp.]